MPDFSYLNTTIANTNIDLYSGQLQTLITEEITKYLVKLEIKDSAKIVDYLQYLEDLNLYSLFQPKVLLGLVEKVFNDSTLTNFVFSVTSALNLRIQLSPVLDMEYLITAVTNSVGKDEKYTENSMLPNDIKNTLDLDPNVLYEVLVSNNWLLWISYMTVFVESQENFLDQLLKQGKINV